jgi:hypothetical protein
VILSFIFLRKPNWLHRQRRPAFIVRNIGHRGGNIMIILYYLISVCLLGAGESIENSLLAFDK